MDAVAVWGSDGRGVYVEARRATFGGGYDTDLPLCRPVRASPFTAAGSSALENVGELRGSIGLVLRGGGVGFVHKARAVQAAGGRGLVVLNTEDENFVPCAPDDDPADDVTIPVVCVSAAHTGQLLAAADEAAAVARGAPRSDQAAGGEGAAAEIQLASAEAGGGEDGSAAGASWEERAGEFAAADRGAGTMGLLFSAANLREAVEAGDQEGARTALLSGQPGVCCWHRTSPWPRMMGGEARPPATDDDDDDDDAMKSCRRFDPLVWDAQLPCRGGTYHSRASPPLFVASYLGHEPVVRLLVVAVPRLCCGAGAIQMASAEVSTANLHPTPLAERDDAASLQRLHAEAAAWAEAQTNADGWSPLVAASWRGHVSVVRSLLDGDMPMAKRSATAAGGTAIVAACDGGDWPTCVYLLVVRLLSTPGTGSGAVRLRPHTLRLTDPRCTLAESSNC
jgi:hypothetical protein